MLCLLLGQTLMAQNTFPGTGNVGVGTTTPAASAILEVRSNTQGILIPRMSQIKREAIVDPALGLIVFQTTTPKGIYLYLGSGWQQMGQQGDMGLTGPAGPTGATGPMGPEGPAGADGLNGAVGATGATGPMGPMGPEGPAGADGVDGTNGIDGVNGLDGATGATGPMGPEGPAGPAGADGADGFLTAGSASGNTPFWDGTDWITNSSNLYNAGSNIGIGTTTPNHQLELSTDDAAKPGTNTWTVVSDQRLKENINAYEGGLSEVLKINPVTFHYNVKSGFDTNPEYVGVLAQELQKVAPSMVNNFTKEGEQYLAINNGEMTYMLINAVKDLNTQVSENNIEIENLNSKIELLEEQLEKVNTAIFGEGSNDGAAIINVGATSNSMLGQNVPNPFDNSTLIPFRIPKNCSDASIMITDAVYGKVISVIPISCDETHVSVDAGTLASGVYSYTLIVNGVVIETKEMVLSK